MTSERISNDRFEIECTPTGIGSLKQVGDKYDTNYVVRGNTLGGLVVRYRREAEKEWKKLSVAERKSRGRACVTYTIRPSTEPFLASATVSVSNGRGYTKALTDQVVPTGSDDDVTPHFAWWPQRGTKEWVQYDFPKEVRVSAVEVYWLEDEPRGGACKVPESWRLLYRADDEWREVKNPTGYGVEKDRFQRTSFDPVKTNGLRLEAQFKEGFCAGILEWRVECDEDERIAKEGRKRIKAAAKEIDATVRFELKKDTLVWKLSIRNKSDEPLEIGDLMVPLRFNTRYSGEKQIKYTQGLVKHSFVSGHGSFAFWMRANGEGPFLAMIPDAATKLECFDVQDDRGHIDNVYIHSAVLAESIREKGGTWRQPNTGATLPPAGSPGAERKYSFRFHWADDYEAVRNLLYKEGKFDVHVVPGMTLPTDLFAMFSLRTKNAIRSVDPEYPKQTELEYMGKKGRDTHIYRVKFSRLGENYLKVNYGDGRYMLLEFFVTEPLETVIKKRAAFLIHTQQHRDPSKWYNGLVCDWDMKNKVLRNPEDDTDGFNGWWNYVLTCDDPGLCKVPYVASKNAVYPSQDEIEGVECYLKHFVWGGLQCTDQEKYPYAIYGVPNWKVNRESEFDDQRGKARIWRIYDYSHIILLYFQMYRIAKHYPGMVRYLDKNGYLLRAYHTTEAFFRFPLEIIKWSPYGTGLYNELIIPDVIDALVEEGYKNEADSIRKHWEQKVENFVNNDLDLYGSEYAFDSTGFESTHAFAKYALRYVGRPDSTLNVTADAARKFLEEQMKLNITVRGWLEPTYYHLGSDYRGCGNSAYTLSYMAQMGGWGVLDYALHFSDDPVRYLRLGYASYLSSWALMNTGTPESNYGYWYPGKENDGGAGGGFEPQPFARNWLGKHQGRGSWFYGCEIDLGFSGGVRSAATIVTEDPLFGLFAYGGLVKRTDGSIEVIPRDGLRKRFHDIRGGHRFHLILDRDGFAKDRPIIIGKNLNEIRFTLENRSGDAHAVSVKIAGLPVGRYAIVAGEEATIAVNIEAGETARVEIPVGAEPECHVAILKGKRAPGRKSLRSEKGKIDD
jgi:hypothetical protein